MWGVRSASPHAACHAKGCQRDLIGSHLCAVCAFGATAIRLRQPASRLAGRGCKPRRGAGRSGSACPPDSPPHQEHASTAPPNLTAQSHKHTAETATLDNVADSGFIDMQTIASHKCSAAVRLFAQHDGAWYVRRDFGSRRAGTGLVSPPLGAASACRARERARMVDAPQGGR